MVCRVNPRILVCGQQGSNTLFGSCFFHASHGNARQSRFIGVSTNLELSGNLVGPEKSRNFYPNRPWSRKLRFAFFGWEVGDWTLITSSRNLHKPLVIVSINGLFLRRHLHQITCLCESSSSELHHSLPIGLFLCNCFYFCSMPVLFICAFRMGTIPKFKLGKTGHSLFS